MDTANTAPFELSSQRLGGLPRVNHFLYRAGLPALLERYLPATDAQVRLAPRPRCGWWSPICCWAANRATHSDSGSPRSPPGCSA